MARASKAKTISDHLLRQHLDRMTDATANLIRPAVPHFQIEVPLEELPPLENEEEFDPTLTAGHRIETADGQMWVEGNSLFCGCPSCTAPMTVRIWLGLADCWRCQSSIELTESQLRQAEELLSDHQTAPTTLPTPKRRLPSIDHAIEQPAPARESNVELPNHRERELERLTEQSILARFVRRGFQITPAWIVSFVLHLIMILLLALIVLQGDLNEPPTIVLSTTIDSSRTEGGEVRLENPLDQLADDLPLASKLDVADRELRDVLQKAMQDAKELQIDPQPTAQKIDVNTLRRNVTTRPDQRMSFEARDPRVRLEIVKSQGGTMMTEAAVARGLRWLASVQNSDGSWSIRDYEDHDDPHNRGDILGTSLALLPFLGAGQTHESGKYRQTVAKGLAWIIRNQKQDGDLRAGFRDNAGMYAHGQAAIVLCESLAMTGDEAFRGPAQRAIQFTERAQHSEGGWRYRPGQSGDTSVFGWHIMALQSARTPGVGLEVDDATLKLADYFLDLMAATPRQSRGERCPEGALYCYQRGRKPTDAITAEAMLCRMYLGWKRDDPRMGAAVEWLMEEHFPSRRDKNVYYWYYGTQVLHHYGGTNWEKWNSRMRELLISLQDTRGEHPGSWNPRGFKWGSQGGRIYTTALSVCTLEVYYRHLPLFKQIKLN